MSSSQDLHISDELLSAYIDDAVSEDERTLVETAVATNAEIAWRLESLRQTVQLLNELPQLALPRSFTLQGIYQEARIERPPAFEPAQTRSPLAWLLNLWRGATPHPTTHSRSARGIQSPFWQSGNLLLRNAAAACCILLVVLIGGEIFLQGIQGPDAPSLSERGTIAENTDPLDAVDSDSVVANTESDQAEPESAQIVAMAPTSTQSVDTTQSQKSAVLSAASISTTPESTHLASAEQSAESSASSRSVEGQGTTRSLQRESAEGQDSTSEETVPLDQSRSAPRMFSRSEMSATVLSSARAANVGEASSGVNAPNVVEGATVSSAALSKAESAGEETSSDNGQAELPASENIEGAETDTQPLPNNNDETTSNAVIVEDEIPEPSAIQEPHSSQKAAERNPLLPAATSQMSNIPPNVIESVPELFINTRNLRLIQISVGLLAVVLFLLWWRSRTVTPSW